MVMLQLCLARSMNNTTHEREGATNSNVLQANGAEADAGGGGGGLGVATPPFI